MRITRLTGHVSESLADTTPVRETFDGTIIDIVNYGQDVTIQRTGELPVRLKLKDITRIDLDILNGATNLAVLTLQNNEIVQYQAISIDFAYYNQKAIINDLTNTKNIVDLNTIFYIIEV